MTVTSYFQPASVPEALALLDAHGPELLVIAGGTVAMPLINEGISLPRRVMGLRRAGLDAIERRDGELHVGATATLTQLAGQAHVPMLATAARRSASWSVRNMGTVGGNLFTPPPGGDVATALLALGAHVVATGSHDERSIPLDAFWTGFMTTDLAEGELVTRIVVPPVGGRSVFLKLGRRAANTPAVVTVAAHAVLDGDTVVAARIALGAVGPHPIRARQAEAAVIGAALDEGRIAAAAGAAAQECDPATDAVASEWYRRRMVDVMVRRALAELAQPADRRA